MVRLEIDDKEVAAGLEKLVERCKNLRPLMKNIGQVVRASVLKNFETEGRPGWKKSKKAKGRTLTDSGRLKNSIAVAASKDSVAIGTNVIYAGTHQFGAEQGLFGTQVVRVNEHTRKTKRGRSSKVKRHTRRQLLPWGDIPARPFLVLQPQDEIEIDETTKEFFTKPLKR